MSKITPTQKLLRAGIPYTKTMTRQVPYVDESDELPVVRFVTELRLFGYTLEEVFMPPDPKDPNGDGEWKKIWEEHDLGIQPSLEVASEVAGEWRTSLVGNYGAS